MACNVRISEGNESNRITKTEMNSLNISNSTPPNLYGYGKPLNADKLELGNTVKLFNGRNLKGWYTFLTERDKNNDPKKVFTVKDGNIHISEEEWRC